MKEVILTSGVITLFYALVALFLVWAVLRIFDKSSVTPFSAVKEVILSDSISTAIYYGLRFSGACMLVGLVISG
jgi:ABC-type sulfate transport system permease component